jgi:hypothetical protein
MLLADNKTKVDLLNNEAIATTIVTLLRGRPDKPVTVGVHGDWGAGTRQLTFELVRRIKRKRHRAACRLHDWRRQ